MALFDLASLTLPIVQAPMAGGPSTPALAAAVGEAGGLGFVAAGYRAPEQVVDDIAAVRAATAAPLGVNLFVPSPAPSDPGLVATYRRELEPEVARGGVELGEPRFEDDAWEAKLELVAAARVAVVSFTFGCPATDVFERLHAAGVAAWVTITTAAEARLAADAGADAVVVQGAEAGGHRASFADDGSGVIGLLPLLRAVAPIGLPMIAAGAIADGATLAAVLCAGAVAGQLGTALMLAPEAATSAPHRALLREGARPTRLTRAFTGRLARGLENRFLVEHDDAPSAYPEIHHLTAPLRAAARSAGDPESINLWAGEAYALARDLPAAEIVAGIAADARAELARAAALLPAP